MAISPSLQVAGMSLCDNLAARIAGPIQFSRKFDEQDGETDGAFLQIATLAADGAEAAPPIEVEVWLDAFATTSGSGRRLWVGFASNKRRALNKIVQAALSDYPPTIHQRHDNDVQMLGGVASLKNPLALDYAGRPIYEKYSPRSYFGIYDLLQEEEFLAQAEAFVITVLERQPQFIIDETNADNYRAFENRQTVAVHLRRERDRELARKCKVRDGYRCQICQMKFSDIYGEIGLNFAEAHHKVPLSKVREEVINTVDALITVCANCHRMLHRMPGNASDIATLRKRLS